MLCFSLLRLISKQWNWKHSNRPYCHFGKLLSISVKLTDDGAMRGYRAGGFPEAVISAIAG